MGTEECQGEHDNRNIESLDDLLVLRGESETMRSDIHRCKTPGFGAQNSIG
jgi:hypothetical protein